MPHPDKIENQVSISPSFIQEVSKQLEYLDSYDHIRQPDSVRIQQNDGEGWIQFEHNISNGEGDA